MQVYRTIDIDADPVEGRTDWHGTLAEAHAAAKLRFPVAYSRSRARIELIDVDVSKGGVLVLLNAGPSSTWDPVRTWGLTDRGGLRELPRGE